MPYHKITTKDGRTLFISECHLLPVNTVKNLVPACRVQKGDLLFTETGQDIVMDVEIVIKRGAFCPHTTGEEALPLSTITVGLAMLNHSGGPPNK